MTKEFVGPWTVNRFNSEHQSTLLYFQFLRERWCKEFHFGTQSSKRFYFIKINTHTCTIYIQQQWCALCMKRGIKDKFPFWRFTQLTKLYLWSDDGSCGKELREEKKYLRFSSIESEGFPFENLFRDDWIVLWVVGFM